MAEAEQKCAAVTFDDADGVRWECERCLLAWDEGDVRPGCAIASLTRLHDGALDEALRIEASQHALVASGLRKFRHQPQLNRAMELRALARLVDWVKEKRGGSGAR